MRLIRLHVEGFGALHDYRLELGEGLNVLCERNGWGKSTLAVFIKAMLYGLPATTKKSLDENERRKYAPWQGGVYGGSLELSCAAGRFRIERFFGERESGDRFALFDLDTNKPSAAFSERIGEELLGIDADGFERSTYLSQRQSYVRSENTSIRTRLGDLLDDVNDMGSFDICPYCGWEDDDLQLNNPDYSGGANNLSLNEYQADYAAKIVKNPKYKWGK